MLHEQEQEQVVAGDSSCAVEQGIIKGHCLLGRSDI